MRSFFWGFLILPTVLSAADLAPWSGVDLELHPRIVNVVQTYPSHTNYFLGMGLEASYDVWQLDVEVNSAITKHRGYSFDDFRLTGRYRWMDDVIGDPVSIYTGITYVYATHHSLRDPNLFHHGTAEGEVHVALGKEFDHRDRWITRFWGVGVVGIANQGSPWVRAEVAFERNWCDQHVVAVFLDTLWGLGNRSLHTHHFHGYGSVRHRSIDVGAQYKWRTIYDSVLTFGYAYRPYACNFPKHVNTFMVQWMIPYGL
jgi:hypothetical protein